MSKILHWLLITWKIRQINGVISSQTITHEVRKNLGGILAGAMVVLDFRK